MLGQALGAGVVIADKGDDTDDLIERIKSQHAKAAIPRAPTATPHGRAAHFAAVVICACIRLWLA